MKIILMSFLFLILIACSYTVKVGKKCTPNNSEWSYVWFVEKEGSNVKKENCMEENK